MDYGHPVLEHFPYQLQTQALELDGGKVLLALGQHAASRRLVVFDPQWLYETGRSEDRQGVVWNFPAGLIGRLEVECRIDGEGFQLALCDHWINPCDETVAEKAALAIPVTAETLGGSGKWTTLTLVWDWKSGKAMLVCGGLSRTFELRTGGLSPFGPSYLHLQTLARETDFKGAYFRAFRKTAHR